MKLKWLFPLLMLLSSVLFLHACDEVFEPIIIRGTVVDVNTSQPISNATVAIVSPSDLAQTTISNQNGEFMFEEVVVDSVIDITFEAFKDGFSTERITVLAAPERELVVPNLKIRDLQADDTDPGDEPSNGEGGAAEIQLQSISTNTINIAETGGGSTSAFTFIVLDSTGTVIAPNRAVDVEFRITQGPNGGESISPQTVKTNENGLATSTIFAGNAAGNMKIEAKIERPEHNLTIRSAPIALTIHGGFPSPDHFSIALNESTPQNIPGYLLGFRASIDVLLGDKFSNPVKPETPVYFNTDGGVIQGSGFTDDDGELQVDLIVGNPPPPNGFATIRAHTFDENENELSRETQVLFSGPPSVSFTDLSPTQFNFLPDESRRYALTVTDSNGNPLPAGTTISIESEEDVSFSIDSFTVPSTMLVGRNRTEFSFTVTASDEFSGNVIIEVSITAPGLDALELTFPN